MCNAAEPDTLDYNCEYLRGLQFAYPDGRGEIGVRQLDHLAQQAWSQGFDAYNPDFSTNGWYEEGTPYDLSPVAVPMSVMFVRDDTMADEVVNGALYDQIPSVQRSVRWMDGRGHMDLNGANDEMFFDELLAQLSDAQDVGAETRDCTIDDCNVWY